jgi:hypothetical protein
LRLALWFPRSRTSGMMERNSRFSS